MTNNQAYETLKTTLLAFVYTVHITEHGLVFCQLQVSQKIKAECRK